MNTHAPKTQENKSQAAANRYTEQRRTSESTLQFIDNRPEAIAQRKLQEMANNSRRKKKIAQLQGLIKNNHTPEAIRNKENKDRAAAFSVTQNKSAALKQGFGFVDKPPHSLKMVNIQKNLRGQNPGKGTKGMNVMQRYPVQISGVFYKDSEFPYVRMEKLKTGENVQTNTYVLLNGPKKGTNVRYLDGDYYETDSEGWDDPDKRVSMINYVATSDRLMRGVTHLNVGSPGIGVRAGYNEDVTLETSGIVSCVGFLIYNDEAAYLEHIVVVDVNIGELNNEDQIKNSVMNIINRLIQKTDIEEYNIQLTFNKQYNTRKDKDLIKSLNPQNKDVEIRFGGGVKHKVRRSGNPRRMWECNKIVVQYDTS